MAGGELMLDTLIFLADVSIGASFLTVFLKLRTSRSAAGLSLQSILALVSARTLHLVSHPLGLHYRPTVLPWFPYPAMDAINAVAGAACLTALTVTYFKTYEREKDNFGIHIFEHLDIVPKAGPFANQTVLAGSFLYLTVMVGALLWYCVRRSPHTFGVSFFCCFYEVMSAICLIPQLWMFHQNKRVSRLLGDFVVIFALGRLCTLCFWVSYPWVHFWRYPDNRGIQMASEALNILILSDFLYYYVRSRLKGESEVILGDGMLV